MISNYLQQFIFHILFTTTVCDVNVRFLQINEPVKSICIGIKCIRNEKVYVQSVINFLQERKPDVTLWFSNFIRNRTIFPQLHALTNSTRVVLPVPNNDEYHFNCFNIPKVTEGCYYLYVMRPSNVPIIVLNTRLWLDTQRLDLSNKQFDWLNTTLRGFHSTRTKVIIVGYNAPGFLENRGIDSTVYDPEINRKMVGLLQLYSAAISVCIFGSKMVDSFRIVMDNHGKPRTPMFIAPTMSSPTSSSISRVRIYDYNINQSTVDDYTQYHTDRATSPTNLSLNYHYKHTYDLKNIHVNELFAFTQSFLSNSSTDNFLKYRKYQLGNLSLSSGQCASAHCVRCRCHCFILSLTESSLRPCLSRCSILRGVVILSATGSHSNTFNNPYLRLGVIVGFVAILVGIVIAVNKVYCIRLSRHRNVFLAPLPADLTEDIERRAKNNNNNNDVIKVNDDKKLTSDNENDVSSTQTKPINGHKRLNNHESEQTYDYIRM